MNISRVITTATVGTALLLGGTVACADNGDETVEVAEYDDCDTNDQGPPPFLKREDDCGYWRHPDGDDVAVADHQFASDWVWVWFVWVVLGQNSKPWSFWAPPKGINPPTKIVRVPKRKACAMGITDVLVAPAPPKPPAPKAPAPAPKINTNTQPKQQPKQYTPPKPGQRPAGC